MAFVKVQISGKKPKASWINTIRNCEIGVLDKDSWTLIVIVHTLRDTKFWFDLKGHSEVGTVLWEGGSD